MNDRVGVLRSFVKKNKSVVRPENGKARSSNRQFDNDSVINNKFFWVALPPEFVDLLEKKESKNRLKKDPNFQPNIGLSTRSRKIANNKP